jgi:hypothetical protein
MPKGPNLDASLSADEFVSLNEVAKRIVKQTIPAAHKAKLIKLGFISEALGGLVPTDAGRTRLARGK